MAIVTTDDKHYAAIADMIRFHAKTRDTYTPEQMPEAVGTACTNQYAMGAYDGYEQGKAEGHIIKSGTFTVTEDASSLHLDIPSDAKLVEIVPQGTPSETIDAFRIPVHYLFASENFKNSNAAYLDKGAFAQYFYNSQGYTSFFAFDTGNGLDIALTGGLIFEANMTYNWTAHYWQE